MTTPVLFIVAIFLGLNAVAILFTLFYVGKQNYRRPMTAGVVLKQAAEQLKPRWWKIPFGPWGVTTTIIHGQRRPDNINMIAIGGFPFFGIEYYPEDTKDERIKINYPFEKRLVIWYDDTGLPYQLMLQDVSHRDNVLQAHPRSLTIAEKEQARSILAHAQATLERFRSRYT